MACASPQKYTFFWRSASPFSQWYKCKFTVDGILYNCAEQYMMHQKAVMFGDREIADQIMKSTSQKQQKSLGRKVSNFNEETWNDNSKEIVYKGNFAKFSQNNDIKQKLLDTEGTILVEASPVDSIWGIGYAEDHPNARDQSKWRGQNRLGFILTDVREAILKESQAALTQKNGAPNSDPQKYTFFWKNESPFSQWYRCNFVVDGLSYNCAEQYMMQQKAVLFKDHVIADCVMKTDSPRKQKALGRKVSNFDQQVWEDECKQIVYKGNMAKFSQNEDLKQILLETQGTVLAEASPVDCIWGIGYKEDHPNAKNRYMWKGENRLGFILTEVRDAILKGQQEPGDVPHTKVHSVKMEEKHRELSDDITTLQNSTLSEEKSLDQGKKPIEGKVEEKTPISEDENQIDGPISSIQVASDAGLSGNNDMKEDWWFPKDVRNATETPTEGQCKERQFSTDTGKTCPSKSVTGATEDNISEKGKDPKETPKNTQMTSDSWPDKEEATWQVVTGKGKRKKFAKK